MAVVEVSVTPLGAGTGVSRFVAGALRRLKESGLHYQLTPMGTVIEGDLDEILKVVRLMHEAPFDEGVQRVSTLIKIDDRRDVKAHTLTSKVRSVEEKL